MSARPSKRPAARPAEIEADVIVVGAGLSGLVAARDLKRAGLQVAVIEARERVGGRLLSASLGRDRTLDLGGAYFGPGRYAIEGLSRELGITSFPTNEEGYSQIDTGQRLVRYRGFMPNVGLLALCDSFIALRKLERMGAQVPLGEPWAARRAAHWDSQTLWSWTENEMRTKRGRRLIRLACEGMFGASASEVSLLHALSYSNANGGFQYVLSVRDGHQQRRFRDGAQGICLRLADELGANELHLGRPVQRVVHGHNRVIVEGEGFSASARRAVMAVPLPLAGSLTYEPQLPYRRQQLTKRMIPGATIKCHAIYDRPFWRELGLSGQVGSVDPGSLVRAVLDATPYQGDPGVLEAFVVGPAAARFSTMEPQTARQAILSELAHFFGSEAGNPDDFIVQNWIEEPYTRGCYHSFAQCGVYRTFGPALRETTGSLHWAGSESGAHAMGSMGGAVEAGHRAATEVIAARSA